MERSRPICHDVPLRREPGHVPAELPATSQMAELTHMLNSTLLAAIQRPRPSIRAGCFRSGSSPWSGALAESLLVRQLQHDGSWRYIRSTHSGAYRTYTELHASLKDVEAQLKAEHCRGTFHRSSARENCVVHKVTQKGCGAGVGSSVVQGRTLVSHPVTCVIRLPGTGHN